MTVSKYKYIIWDWNGTLLDDVQYAVSSMNKLLQRRKLPLLDTEHYTKVFTFPVRNYYQKLGFNFAAEPFEKLAVEYLSEYYSHSDSFTLHKDAESILKHFFDKGIKQFLLSASAENELLALVEKLGIKSYFILIIGLDNQYSDGKIERAKKALSGLQPDRQEIIVIGDTVHDFEVAKALGCNCLLVANGHQCRKRLEETGAAVVSSLGDIYNFV